MFTRRAAAAGLSATVAAWLTTLPKLFDTSTVYLPASAGEAAAISKKRPVAPAIGMPSFCH